MKAWASVAVVCALAGCEQLPPNVSEAHAIKITGANAEFVRCTIGMTFNDQPRSLDPGMMRQIAGSLEHLPKFIDWEMDGLMWNQASSAQVAVCLCADTPLNQAQRDAIESSFRKDRKYQPVTDIGVPFSRLSVESESRRAGSDLVTRTRIHLPTYAPNCFLIQAAAFPPGASRAADAFLASTRPSPLR